MKMIAVVRIVDQVMKLNELLRFPGLPAVRHESLRKTRNILNSPAVQPKSTKIPLLIQTHAYSVFV